MNSEKQDLLRNSHIVVVGVGGLGSTAALYLAGAGVGSITLVDFDQISLSNLHRQPIYTTEQVGQLKVDILGNHLRKLNPEITVNTINERLSVKNGRFILASSTVVLDCTDNYSSRYLINDLCVQLDKPFVSASLYRYEGQLGVFNYCGGPTYRCYMPKSEKQNTVSDCNEAGVMGTLPAILGNMQASEAIKIITKSANVMNNKILLTSGLSNATSFYNLEKDLSQIKLAKSREFESEDDQSEEITPKELLQQDPSQFVIIDVRELHEEPRLESENVIQSPASGEIHIPTEYKDYNLVFVCQSGQRSAKAVKELTAKGFKAINLKNGLNGWPNVVRDLELLYKPIKEEVNSNE